MPLISITAVRVIPRDRALLPQLMVAQLLEEFPARPEPQYAKPSLQALSRTPYYEPDESSPQA